ESPSTTEPAPALDATATSVLSFAGMTAGLESSCGLTSDSRGYCWGLNNGGQLGDGTRTNRSTPVPVAGGLHFRQLNMGFNGTACGVTTSHLAYCWGLNVAGAIGNGTLNQTSTPAAVSGGHTFLQAETSNIHTCGVSYPDGHAWCWGSNAQGQLGTGTTR